MSKTEPDKLDDTALDAMFAAARAETPEPSAGLMARILADAENLQAARDRPPRPMARPGPWARFVDGLGGWTTLAGLVTATLAGVWFGFVSPERLDTLSGGLLLADGAASYALEDILPADDGLAAFYEEGGQ
ncbi:dihydroorotate dehydrogenase [Maritimibacter sp. HL-12]|jgi:hypothetical protein|uniref:dihydroorotate dehydrogenase n=1 Tax=Maritimibacter sp. HL-12 TaxID=1162418 RepID=UPI000A0EEC8E|nr:dihydroorotate dehydrogenase [Maritimibacter sp. HL-12]SMH33056.1 hypothetical protein SAMN05661107_0411 [Maritimibacter sp. HL-12]